MSATIKIYRWTGASTGTGADITGANTRANAYDTNTTNDTTNPVRIPATSTTNTITNVALTSNVVTITTGSAHGLLVGEVVTVTAVTNTAVNGTFTVASTPLTTTFTYALTHANISSGADTGTISATSYSYWVSTRLHATTSPAGTINNLKWFTDGSLSFGTGVGMIAQTANVGGGGGYVQATGTAGTSGIQLTTTAHSGLTGAPVNPVTYTSGSPLSLTGSITNPTTGDFGDFLVYQLSVLSTASPGASSQSTLTFRYDET